MASMFVFVCVLDGYGSVLEDGSVSRPPLALGGGMRFAHHMCTARRGYALLALDVAFDTRMNAHVLDINSGPSFYHISPPNNWPRWCYLMSSLTPPSCHGIPVLLHHVL